ncbi:FKBP-type peptidyl-prolyl cis-trans isomerase [Shewanella sp. NIFS-20-20]|uniref:FKBP-type peptidyl-prolyl cis-trans isomerase n=1 Tax=Shewanella sp. NIFS-20-20 TaxID=2853806 RepID=UPI001C466AC3|nr:FKBP-type peptidyl-prolyl cis-trans isomerase [Shewanella sp. NIFS-20-20]MBV7316969.1 FKBP-type peptidyl-prolyl cis-trans isomerase [Shewanella sp. NIFS-20-20]
MKINSKKFLLASTIAFTLSAPAWATDLSTDVNKESYSVGVSVGNYLSNQIYNQTELGAEINIDVMIEGFVDALKNTSDMSEEQVVDYLNKRGEFLNQKRNEEIARISQKHLDDGAAFMANNAKNDKVVTTESGLQYEVLIQGAGELPKPESVVTVNYVGKLIDGTEFESTYMQNKPARFALMSVIEGWQEGLKLMPMGSTYRFTIPAALAYGEDGAGAIPPQATLVFDIELVNVEAPKSEPDLKSMMGHG